MERGFVPDKFNHQAAGVSSWATGAPKKSFWFGTKSSSRQIPIAVFRCADCGFLEFYARREFAAE